MVLLREKGTTADCLQIMAYSINCHAILLLQMVRLYITPLCIYRDPAHPLRVHLQGPFEGDALTLGGGGGGGASIEIVWGVCGTFPEILKSVIFLTLFQT